MARKIIHTDRVPPGRARISQAVALGDLVFVSGIVARDPATGMVPPGGVGAQTRRILLNMQAILEKAGTDLSQVLKTSCYLSDMDDFGQFNVEWEKFFPKDPPARICVQARLGADFAVEIDAVAALAKRKRRSRTARKRSRR